MKKYSILIIQCLLFSSNVIGNDFNNAYQACLTNLSNYNTDGYKAIIVEKGYILGRDSSIGVHKIDEGYYNFIIDGYGYVLVSKNEEKYYTRKGDFFYDSVEREFINRDGFVLDLKKVSDHEMSLGDIAANIQLFKVDINVCTVIENSYFSCDLPVEIDDSQIFFGYSECSNVSAFSNLLEMHNIVSHNKESIKDNVYVEAVLSAIILLISKLNTDENRYRDENWYLIKKWLPYISIISCL
jgi:flagellar basal body rod protein FlgG